MKQPSSIELKHVSKAYPGAVEPALDDVSLSIEPGAFFSILGPSGCGKTTLLRIIAGFEHPTEGRVLIDGQDITGLPPRARDIAMVFQDYALYPHMTAGQNITFNLRNKKVPQQEISERLATTANTLGIEALLHKKPNKLSGGERQRVALGRALIRKPRVFLMDEPLSNLDLKLREAMRIELGRLHQELDTTTLFVTHDQSEAMTLSTAMAVLHKGLLQQVGKPNVVYDNPANTFVARFIGSPSMNIFRMKTNDIWFTTSDPTVRLPRRQETHSAKVQQDVLVGIRPHHFHVVHENDPGISIEVNLVEHLGRSNFVICSPLASDSFLFEQETIQLETEAAINYEPGTQLRISADPEKITVFDLANDDVECALPSETKNHSKLPKEIPTKDIGQ